MEHSGHRHRFRFAFRSLSFLLIVSMLSQFSLICSPSRITYLVLSLRPRIRDIKVKMRLTKRRDRLVALKRSVRDRVYFFARKFAREHPALNYRTKFEDPMTPM